MSSAYDLAIIGAGSFGMSTGYYAARAGARVLLIDAGDPPHSNGSHHGKTRIFRSAYTMGPQYVSLALRSRELWERLRTEVQKPDVPEAAHHAEIYREIGVLSIGPAGSHFLTSKLQSCRDFGIPHEHLTATELANRWPGLRVPDGAEGLFEPQAGVLFSENIIRAYRELALAHGARLHPNTRVLSISRAPGSDGVHRIESDRGAFRASRVLVAAGAYSAEVLPELRPVLQPLRKPIAWFHAPDELYGEGVFPVFIVNDGQKREYFGFPSMGEDGLKVGRHDGGHPAVFGETLPPFGYYEQDERDLREFLDRYLPSVGPLREGGVCLYEISPDEHFLIGPVPGRTGIWFAGGGSGHGFKFASAVGEALARELTGGNVTGSADLSAFYFDL